MHLILLKTIKMESKKTTLASNSLQFGLLTGIMLVGFSLLLFASGWAENRTLSYISYIFIAIGLTYGTITLRNNVLGGYINFSTAFKSCFLILLYAAIISAVFTYVYVQFIDKTFIEKILVKAEQDMILKGLESDKIETTMDYTRRLVTPLMMMLMSFLGTLLAGSIIGLIVAGVLKRENPNPTASFDQIK